MPSNPNIPINTDGEPVDISEPWPIPGQTRQSRKDPAQYNFDRYERGDDVSNEAPKAIPVEPEYTPESD